MTHLAIIVAIWAIMLIIAFVFLPAWRKRHDAGKGLYARSQDDNKLSVNYALKVMNCKVKWTDDHEDLVARYTYQGGHFNIRLEKDSPYVRLSYFYFFEAGSHDLELVRNVCNQTLRAAAKKLNIPMQEGAIHSSDVFYRQPSDASPKYWEKLRDERGCLAVEMESFALFHNANVTGKQAACLLTISDSFVSPEITSAEERQKCFTNMMKIALEMAQ